MSSGTLLSIKEGDFLMTKKRRVQVSFTEQQIEQLERLSKEKGFTKSAILALALEEYSRKELEQKK
ncbi:CopG family transcriptional regulator [Aliarcobacter butzleri]